MWELDVRVISSKTNTKGDQTWCDALKILPTFQMKREKLPQLLALGDDKAKHVNRPLSTQSVKIGRAHMATITISLPDQMKSWIDEHVQSGHYANASDYVCDLIRRDNAKREALRQALIDGENSGPPQPFDFEEFKEKMHKKYAK